MPTYRDDIIVGKKVPVLNTDDIARQSITEDRLRDKAVTSKKLADQSVSKSALGQDVKDEIERNASAIVAEEQRAIQVEQTKVCYDDIDDIDNIDVDALWREVGADVPMTESEKVEALLLIEQARSLTATEKAERIASYNILNSRISGLDLQVQGFVDAAEPFLDVDTEGDCLLSEGQTKRITVTAYTGLRSTIPSSAISAWEVKRVSGTDAESVLEDNNWNASHSNFSGTLDITTSDLNNKTYVKFTFSATLVQGESISTDVEIE